MPKISIISSLYKTEAFLPKWEKALTKFAEEANKIGLRFEINAVANEPSPAELGTLNRLALQPWFKLHIVPRESIYATWHRGVELSTAEVCTFWNVDDIRNAEAIKDGLGLIAKGAEVIYFPFVYKRFIKLLGLDILVKKVVIDPPLFDQTRFTKEMHCGPFFMFTKSIYQKVGSFDATFRIAGDFDWCTRAAKIGNFIKSTLVAGEFEKRPGTLSGGRNPRQEEENQRVINRA